MLLRHSPMLNAQGVASIRITGNVAGRVETVRGLQVTIDRDAAVLVQGNPLHEIGGEPYPKAADDEIRVETLAIFEHDRPDVPLAFQCLNLCAETKLYAVLAMQGDECLPHLLSQLLLERSGFRTHHRHGQTAFAQAGRDLH